MLNKQQIANIVIEIIGGFPKDREQLEMALLNELTYIEYGINKIKDN
jgi:hypothetical protein